MDHLAAITRQVTFIRSLVISKWSLAYAILNVMQVMSP